MSESSVADWLDDDRWSSESESVTASRSISSSLSRSPRALPLRLTVLLFLDEAVVARGLRAEALGGERIED